MKHCGDPWTASGMKDYNKRHEAPVRAFLTRLVNDPPAHARFLNMLSMLEHMGSRKIMVSQMDKGETLDQDVLQHLAEEARHAYFFKRHAERVNGAAMPGWVDANTMTRVPALMYFGRMDAGISKRLGAFPPSTPPASGGEEDCVAGFRGVEPYYWVSLIIELRACWLYAIYDEIVEEAGVHLPLKGLIAEEDGHLEEMFAACGDNHDLLQELSRYETDLFEKLWGALEVGYPASNTAIAA